MYALERKVFLKTGHCPRDCWQRYAVSANRPLLDRVRAGQPKKSEWRVVVVPCLVETSSDNFARSA